MTATMWALYVGHRRAGLRAVLEVSVRASVLAERSAWILARELEEHETREDGGRGPLAWRLSEHFNMRPWREQRRRDLAEFLGDDPRLRTVPNGVPLFDLSRRDRLRASKRAELGIQPEEELIVAVGRLVPQKRPLAFLEEARRVAPMRPRTRFLWVGDGDLAGEWDARVRTLGLESRVLRLPWQSEVAPLLFAADLFLHVAEFEGLPLAILEAMSAALPCAIAAHLLAEMPFFSQGEVLPVADDAAWARVLDDPPRLAAMGARMRQLAEERFSFAAMAAAYEALYLEALAR